MKETIAPFTEHGKFTQLHNVIFDEVMPNVSANAFKVLCLIVRRTKGWGKKSDLISYRDVKTHTGIKSDTTVSGAIKELLEMGCILKKEGIGQFEPTTYALNRNFKITTSKNVVTSKNEVVQDAAPTSKNEVATTSFFEEQPTSKNEEYCTKENSTKESKESTARKIAPSAKKPVAKSFIHGATVPLDNPLHQAVMRCFHITAASTEKAQQEAEQTAAALLAANRTAAEMDLFITNWWKHSFFGTTHKRKPRHDEVRDNFDEILNLDKGNPNERIDRAERNRRATVSDLQGIEELGRRVRDLQAAENGLHALPESAASGR